MPAARKIIVKRAAKKAPRKLAAKTVKAQGWSRRIYKPSVDGTRHFDDQEIRDMVTVMLQAA